MNTIGQPKKEMASQPMHHVQQETEYNMYIQQPHRLRDEQGQPMPKLLRMEVGENIPSTSHQSVATSQRRNDFPSVICKLCSQQYKDPRLLDCLHSFCRTCLDKPEVFKTSSERGRIIRCPDCYQDMDVPPTGVSGLDQDCVTARYVEEQAIKRQLLAPENKILCQSCNEHQLAVARCLDCNDFLCTACKMAHQRLSKMKSHTLVTLADLQSGKVALKTRKVKVVKCKRHAQQDLCMFCKTCQEMICVMCTILTHCKPDHDATDIKTVEASCRTEILNGLMPMKTDIKELQVAKTSAEQAKKRLESNVNKILDKMANKKKAETAKLSRRAKILKDKTLSVAKEREEVLEKCVTLANMNATETEYIFKKVNSIVSDGDCHDIITLKEKLLKNLKRVSLKKTQNVPLDLSFMDFAESSTSGNNLGELLLEEVWTCKETFGNNSIPACVFDWAKAVAARSNGDIVVVDSGTTRVITLTSKGVQKGSLSSTDPRGILMTPIDIALSSSENILVLDTTVIKVFNKEGHFISRLVLPQSVTMPKCIDAGYGKIVIGIAGTILLFNEDGSNPISISAKLIDKHIAICSKTQSIIYTNYDMSRLISVDFSGKEIFNISTVIEAKSVKPTGVCTDENGDIYIAMHTGLDRGSGEIHHYSPEGSYIRFVAKTLYNPLGLSFSPIGELIVADRHSVKVFTRV